MFCVHCGAPVPEEARFCPLCGAALTDPAPSDPVTTDFPGWSFEIEPGRIEDFTAGKIAPLLESIRKGETPFLIAAPPAQIEGTRYLQFCSDDAMALHAELCVARGTAGFEIYGIDGVGVPMAAEMLGSYLSGSLPRLPDGAKWRLI